MKLKEFATINMGQSPKGETYNANGNGVPFLQGRKTFGRMFPTIDTWTTNPIKIANENEILMSVRAPVGDMNFANQKICIGRGLCSINAKNGRNKYLYYMLLNSMNTLKQKSTGTVFDSINRNDLENLEIKFHSEKEQLKIENILNDIDSKIEVNSKINNNLLSLCRYKYEELNKNNDNWNLVKINDLNLEVTDYVANGSFKSLADNVTLYDEKEYALYVRNTDLKVNFTDKRKYVDQKSYEFLKKSKLNGGELIISNVGDVGSVFICPHFEFPMTLGSNVIMLYSIDEHYYSYFLYFFFTSSYGQYKIKGITGGSAQPKFNKTDFRNMEINIPPLDVLDNFNKYIEPIYKRYELNIKENERLSELRDTLLPKLMNGEINLDNIEI